MLVMLRVVVVVIRVPSSRLVDVVDLFRRRSRPRLAAPWR
jgi:hypothetical protein